MVGVSIDEKELRGLVKDLESLNMSDTRNKTLLRQGMRKAAKPLLQELKSLVPKDTGRLRKSLAVINGKNRKGVPPSVYVGPRVKGAFKSKEKSGYYGAWVEYGAEVMFGGKGKGEDQPFMQKAWDSENKMVLADGMKDAQIIFERALKIHERRLKKYGKLGY